MISLNNLIKKEYFKRLSILICVKIFIEEPTV